MSGERSSDELEAVKRDRARLIAELHGAHRERDSLLAELAAMTRYADAQVGASMRAATELRSLRGVVQAVEALAEKWADGDEVSEWNPLDELRAALGGSCVCGARPSSSPAALAAAADAPQPEDGCACDCHSAHSYGMPCSLISPCCEHAGGDAPQPADDALTALRAEAKRERGLLIADLQRMRRSRDEAQAERDDLREKLDALREHTLDSNPALRSLHDNAVAYRDALAALSEVTGGAPLSTTIGTLIRRGYLAPSQPADPPTNLSRERVGGNSATPTQAELERLRGPSPAVLPQPRQCSGKLGDRPGWMSEGQYDACRCKLTDGHDGEHQCEHTDASLADAFVSSRNSDAASPAVLPEKPRETCSTCGEPMDTPGCSKSPGDDRPRAVAGFHTVSGGCFVAEPVSGVAGNPEEAGEK